MKLRTLMPKGRPSKPDSKWLKRRITEADRAILLAAGHGNISRGYHEVLSFYAFFYRLGYRPHYPRESLTVSICLNNTDSQLRKLWWNDKSYKERPELNMGQDASERP